MEIPKRKHSEVLALYQLEESLQDIYVEGNTDKAIFNTFFRNKNIDKKIFSIEEIDFSELDITNFGGLNLNSNRNRVIILSVLLDSKTPNALARCIIDKDFDDYIENIHNSKLLRTDFRALNHIFFAQRLLRNF